MQRKKNQHWKKIHEKQEEEAEEEEEEAIKVTFMVTAQTWQSTLIHPHTAHSTHTHRCLVIRWRGWSGQELC